MRLFVALELPHATRQRLADLATQLPGARWLPPENYHVTLRFIGEVPRHVAEELDLALAALRARAFGLTLAGVAMTERAGQARTLRVCVLPDPSLGALRAKIERALQQAGAAPERRRFVPHVTLARLDQAPAPRLVQWIQAHNLFRAEPVEIGHFTLFSSLLGHEQAVYTPEVTYALD